MSDQLAEYFYEWRTSLLCPNCGKTCEDDQADSSEPNKEECCGNCDEEFGYNEKLETYDDLSEEFGEFPNQKEIKYYRTFQL